MWLYYNLKMCICRLLPTLNISYFKFDTKNASQSIDIWLAYIFNIWNAIKLTI